MSFISKQRPCISRIRQVIAIIAFHVYRKPSQIAILYKLAHASRHVTELQVMTHCYFDSLCLSEADQFLCLALVDGKRFFDINVTAPVQAEFPNRKVTLWRCSDVYHVGSALLQQFGQV